MDTTNAITALAALAQEHRLAAFRMLAAAGDSGIAAGEVARQIGIPHNTMSSHLATLSNAGLITATREGRSMIYRIVPDAMRDLLGFLTDDCCHGRPELCGILPATEKGCC
jgi:DNA-binding transcriptional ArsR family regulator